MADRFDLTCYACGHQVFTDGNDGYFYCQRCASQAEDIVDTAVNEEDLISGRGIYLPSVPTERISQSHDFEYSFHQFKGTPLKPRLSVFCSEKQLYATLVDEKNKKCLFYGSTLQKSIRGDPRCSIIEAAERIGEELISTLTRYYIMIGMG